jgi:hypothetical protein
LAGQATGIPWRLSDPDDTRPHASGVRCMAEISAGGISAPRIETATRPAHDPDAAYASTEYRGAEWGAGARGRGGAGGRSKYRVDA